MDPTTAEILAGIITAIKSVSNGAMWIMTLLIIVFNYQMNSFITSIKSLTLITHLLILPLQFSGSLDDFLDVFLEFVKFDMLPSDDIWAMILTFDEETGELRVARFGYESKYFLPNSGSMVIFVAISVLK